MRDCFIYLTYSDSQLGLNGDSVISLKSASQTLLILKHVHRVVGSRTTDIIGSESTNVEGIERPY